MDQLYFTFPAVVSEMENGLVQRGWSLCKFNAVVFLPELPSSEQKPIVPCMKTQSAFTNPTPLNC